MRAAFGKVNTLHNHVLPWTDRPLVTQNLVGGEDGINDAGMALSRIFAGVHFRFDLTTGQRLGREVAHFVVHNFLTPRHRGNEFDNDKTTR